VDGFRGILYFKNAGFADEGLVVHEVVKRHGRWLGWEVILTERAGGESERFEAMCFEFCDGCLIKIELV
jgi:hypothetical protein